MHQPVMLCAGSQQVAASCTGPRAPATAGRLALRHSLRKQMLHVRHHLDKWEQSKAGEQGQQTS